jgi:hypothetical protein
MERTDVNQWTEYLTAALEQQYGVTNEVARDAVKQWFKSTVKSVESDQRLRQSLRLWPSSNGEPSKRISKAAGRSN